MVAPCQALWPDHMCHVWDPFLAEDFAEREASAVALVSLPNSGGRLSLVLAVSAVGYFCIE